MSVSETRGSRSRRCLTPSTWAILNKVTCDINVCKTQSIRGYEGENRFSATKILSTRQQVPGLLHIGGAQHAVAEGAMGLRRERLMREDYLDTISKSSEPAGQDRRHKLQMCGLWEWYNIFLGGCLVNQRHPLLTTNTRYYE